MSNTATVLGTRLGARLGTSVGVEGDPALAALLGRLQTIPNSVWFDQAWDDPSGVVTEDDGGTLRFTAILSRPIHTQYTISQPTLSIGPAVALSPNGKLIMSFAGAHYLSGAAALAALIQGSAPYSTVGIASTTLGATRGRFGFSLNAASPDHRIAHYVSAAGNVNGIFRLASGATTTNTGSAMNTAVHVLSDTYSGSVYRAWIDGVEETLTGAPPGTNTRAPAALDDLIVGAYRAAGNPTAFCNGTQAGLIICPGTVLSTDDRVGLQTDLAAYMGYS